MALELLGVALIAIAGVIWLALRSRPAERAQANRAEEAEEDGISDSDNAPWRLATEHLGPPDMPQWNTPGDSLDDATPEQRRFFDWWSREFEEGLAPDLQGNITYVLVYLYERIAEYLADPQLERLAETLKRVLEGYGSNEVVNRYASMWLGNAYLHHGRFDEAWSVFRERNSPYAGIYQILWVRENCSRKTIDGRDFFRCLVATREPSPRDALTSFGLEHFDGILERCDAFLAAFRRVHGVDWVSHYLGRFTVRRLTTADIIVLRRESGGDVDFNERLERYEEWREHQLASMRPDTSFKDPIMLFVGPPGHYQAGSVFEYVEAVPLIVRQAMVARARRIARSLENSVRVQSGVPKIGQGWVAETCLFNQIVERFPGLTIVQHYSPKWLGRQHLDVFVGEAQIAIEYQGEQHDQPVAMWGGQDGLARQKDRDERKRVLCQKHGCELIYAHPGYDFEAVAESIAEAVSRAGLGSSSVFREVGCGDSGGNGLGCPRGSRLSVSIPLEMSGIRARLERLAEKQERSVNYLVVEAILDYLEREEGENATG